MQESPAVVFAFLQRFAQDRESGATRTLGEYRAMFPGHEEVIEREYERIVSDTSFASSSPAAEAHGAPDVVGSRIGPYTLIEELGRGGQGAVFLAQDERLPRKVALKLLLGREAVSLVARERFHREAVVTARLDHPAICTIYETGETCGVAYVAMRYVQGETLARRIAGNRSLPPPDRRELFQRLAQIEEAARALHVAHDAGVLHRDVKPGNLMLTPDGHAVVLDFGLARDLDDAAPTLTLSGDVHGTPAYMSPEQLATTPMKLDRRTDVFSLGVTLFEYLASVRPFDAATREGLFRAILGENPPRLRDCVPAAPRDLEIVIETALAKDRDRRYSTAETFADDLRAIRESRPIAARRPSPFARVAHYVAREPVKATLAAALAVAVLAAAAAVGFLLAQSREIAEGKKALRREEIDRVVLAGFGGFQLPPEADSLEALLADEPDVDILRIWLAVSYLERGRWQSALDVSGRASNDDARAAVDRIRAVALRGLGRGDEADAIEERLDEPTRTPGPFEHFAIGTLLMLPGQDEAAEAEAPSHFAAAVLMAPRAEPAFHFRRAMSAMEAGDKEGALQAAVAMEKLWPGSAMVWFASGSVRGGSGDTRGALVALERAVAIEPEFLEAWTSVGISHLILGDYARADAAYERARACPQFGRDPWTLPANWGQSLCLVKRYEAAIPVLEEAIARNPALETASTYLRKALEETGDVAGAIAECERRLGVANDDREATADRARLRAVSGGGGDGGSDH